MTPPDYITTEWGTRRAVLPDRRYWILNPAGHRLTEARAAYGMDGKTVEWFLGGEATLIVPPLPAATDWCCDICSATILTRWGDEPWPVPMEGSYALCAEHQAMVEESPEDDAYTGDPIPGTRRGPWPLRACTCPPCAHWITEWAKAGYLSRAQQPTNGRL